MEITQLGYSSFKIIGKEISIVTDPFDPEEVGIPFPKVEADVVTLSHQHKGHNNKKAVRGDFICFDSPGEYEIKNAEIVGIESAHDEKEGTEEGKNTIFSYEIDGISICHLGDLGSGLSDSQVEAIDGVDILLIPVGGGKALDAKKAIKVISQIGPKIVIPMHYQTGKKTELEAVEAFTKEMGKEAQVQERLKLQKKELPEEMEIIILK